MDILLNTWHATVYKNNKKMHEHDEKCLNTSSNYHKEPTQMHKHQMGLSPIKKLKNISQRNRNPT